MRRYAGKEQVILFLLVLIFHCASILCVKWEHSLCMEVPTSHLSSTHRGIHPHRGQVTFTVLLPSVATPSQAKGKPKVFSSQTGQGKSIRNPGKPFYPSWQSAKSRSSQEATRQVDGWEKSGVLSVQWSRWAQPAARALVGPHSWTSSRTQPPPDWEQGTFPSLLAKKANSHPQINMFILSL